MAVGFDTSLDSKAWEHFYEKGTDDIPLHYVRKGNGQPVILLHGWPGFWFDWRYVIPGLSQHCDVIAPDFRGFGDSGKPEIQPSEGYTPGHLASDIINLMNTLNIQKAVFVAHDIGATVSQTIARDYPEYVKGLVLLNPPYPGIGSRRFDASIQKEFWYQHLHSLPLAEMLIGGSADSINHYISHFYHHWKGKKSTITAGDLADIIRVYSRPGHFNKSIAYYKARAAAKTVQAVNQYSSLPIHQTTKVLWGEDDPVIPVSWSDKLGEHFSDVTLETLPGIGHFVPFEAPERVIDAVLALA
ncbi:alpha/beta fold hydrolase [Peribacillus glennii]|uniref:Alpha/beta hydrolase n=1 Tax=Peribacillus glennii TaxID=2303991 RepID=A0A372L8C2_9BACI|nr:alpha/beta hydrolase [Peribacillus glennii]RFU61617.1 alpha/beta hydrolase [Peribacillus glennii]